MEGHKYHNTQHDTEKEQSQKTVKIQPQDLL